MSDKPNAAPQVYWEYIGQELAIFWESPYGHGKEKIATFWWPTHPIESTREVEDAFEAIADRLTAIAEPNAAPQGTSAAVAGPMEQTFAEHTRRLGLLIAEEQEKPLPNNVLIAALCDSIRLAREAMVLIADQQMPAPVEAGNRKRAMTKLEALNAAFRCAYIECPEHVINDLKRRFDEYLDGALAAAFKRGQEEMRERAGLRIQVSADGVWLCFQDSQKGQAALNLDEYAKVRGHVVGTVIKNWCDDRRSLPVEESK